MVYRELQQPNTPTLVRQWASSLPNWVRIQSPTTSNPTLAVDPGELEAICLAQEIHATAILMDDRAGRTAAKKQGLAVFGTIGLLEKAAQRGLIDLPTALAQLHRTNARLDLELINAALARDLARRQK